MSRHDAIDDPFAQELSTMGAALPSGAPGLSLRIIHDTIVTTRRLPATGNLIIGRSRDVELPVPHGSISRRHAMLHLGPPFEIEDLGSANGTRVGARRLGAGERAPLVPGVVIELGNVMIVVQGPLPSSAQPDDGAARAPLGLSAPMDQVRRVISRVAAGSISVLLFGETGVGKEVAAEAIHRASPRSKQPFLRLNCASFSESLLTSELFGHEKGAFSGADHTKPGLLETAHGGTVLLDEVGELALPLQAKLLRVLEERAVMRVGGLRPRPIDVRFIAATNRDLAQAIVRGTFRPDLYFRLDGFSIVIPPLRERRDEIAGLARSFLAESSSRLGRGTPPMLAPRTIALLEAYTWPGNVRELRNTMERALLLCAGSVEPEHLPLDKMSLVEAPAAPRVAVVASPSSLPTSEQALREQLQQVERDRILDALDQCAGNQTKAAKLLGIARNTLLTRIESFGLPRPRKRT